MNTSFENLQVPRRETGTLFVLDTTARPPCPVRAHDVLLDRASGVVRTYEFHHNEYLEMPADHAMRFITNDAFLVKKDPEGPRMRPIPVRTEDSVRLQPDQCIANYDELTQGALLSRTKARAGSERFTKGTRKIDLIDFLMDTAAPEAAPREPEDAEGLEDLIDDDDGELDEDELEGLMPKPELPGAA